MHVPLLRLGALLVLGVALAAPSHASACSCMHAPPLAQAVRDSALVFTGTVVSSERYRVTGSQWIQRRIRVRVERRIKGRLGSHVYVYTGGGGSDCGAPLTSGARFGFTLRGTGTDATISSCGGLVDADELIAFVDGPPHVDPGAHGTRTP